MSRRIAVKTLTRSDLTLFRWHYENEPAGKQKAINLNRNVLIDALFPAMIEEAKQKGGRFPLDLYVFGPGNAPELNLQRKIIKQEKNWRLNGELIENPPNETGRFDSLVEGDIAVFEFFGMHFPDSAQMCLVDRASSATLHGAFTRFLGSRSMAQITAADLDALLSAAAFTAFPIGGAAFEATVEDAALGGYESVRKLAARTTRAISKDELRDARRRAEESGDAGEEFVNAYLAERNAAGDISHYSWTSQKNATAAFDFEVSDLLGKGRIDVKATAGGFGNRVHVSTNELIHMTDASVPYRIYRVYELTESTAKLRISDPLKPLADGIVAVLNSLPKGVRPDGVSIDPSSLVFGSEITLSLPRTED